MKSWTYGKVTRLAARVATSIGRAAAQAQSRAVSLDMAETLAVVALLSWIHRQYSPPVYNVTDPSNVGL